MIKLKKPEMFSMAEKGGERSVSEQIGVFFLIFAITMIASSMPAAIIMVNQTLEGNLAINPQSTESIINSGEDSRLYLYAMLYGTIITTLGYIGYAKLKEKRSMASLGFKGNKQLRDYVVGLLIGFAMFSAVVGINLLTGAMTIENNAGNLGTMGIIYILIYFFGFFFQGASEEIMVRGYLMVNLGAKNKTITAIAITSIIFALLHGANPGISFIALVNLILIAVFFALYVICFDNIWGACAIHSIWNFVQGCLYGIEVSGMNIIDTVFNTNSVAGHDLINGGAFGAEGGLASTIVIGVSIILLLVYMKKKNKFEGTLENSESNNVL